MPRPIRNVQSQDGVALLISIFVLLLICVVAIALIVSSGTESALSGNYRSATAVYYAALAGLEEARGRLLPKNPNYFLNTNATFLPPPGTPLAVGQVSYIINPAGSETVAPWDTSNPATYPDNEFTNEFNSAYPMPGSPPYVNSVSTVAGIPGPLYKWVRINAVTEQSLGINIDNRTPPLDNTTPVFYDGTSLNLTSTGVQVFSITSYAVLPNGSSKMLQYTVSANSIILPPFPAALTIVGNNVDFTGPNSATWSGNGNDTISLGSCAPGLPVYAVGYTNSSDSSRSNISQGTFTAARYTGQGTAPSLGFVGGSIPMNFQTEAGLNNIAQTVIQDQLYDKLWNRNVTGADLLPLGMSPSNPMTIVVNGDLDLRSNFHSTGYGLIIVSGTFYYDPDSSWNGIILVIGQGAMTAIHGLSSDHGQIVGAVLVAKTVGSPISGMPGTSLPDSTDYNVELPDTAGSTMGGNGFLYSSCWVKAATPTGSYHVLSFHEITQ